MNFRRHAVVAIAAVLAFLFSSCASTPDPNKPQDNSQETSSTGHKWGDGESDSDSGSGSNAGSGNGQSVAGSIGGSSGSTGVSSPSTGTSRSGSLGVCKSASVIEVTCANSAQSGAVYSSSASEDVAAN